MKYSLQQLEDLFFNIGEIINFVEQKRLEDRTIKFFLSNNESLNFKITNESIAHLLGVKTNYLGSTGMFGTKNSFELLKEMISNPNKIYEYEKKGIIKYDLLFSKHIENKVNHFLENIKFNINDIEFVCKYDSTRTYTISDQFEKFNYILVKKMKNEKIGVVCMIRNQGYYAPMSHLIFNSEEEAIEKLKDLVKHQEVTIVNAFNISDKNGFFKPVYLYLERKYEKIRKLIGYKDIFDASIDLSSDYLHVVDKLLNAKSDNRDLNFIVDKIVDSIKGRKTINPDEIDFQNLVPIIEAYNEIILNSNGDTKDTLLEFKNKILSLEEKNNKLKNEKQDLENDNNCLINLAEQMIKIKKPRK